MDNFHFPLGIAADEYFCNRINETNILIQNIQSCTHTVIISPRRYGKTSLAYQGIQKCAFPYAKIDLYLATDPQAIQHAIIKGINAIIGQITGITEKILFGIKKYLTSLKPTLDINQDGIKLVLEPTSISDPTTNICEGLQILSTILEKKKIKAVILIDEFQEIEKIAKNRGIEGAIRHVAQATKHFSIIFSGSKRHLLKSMFNDRNKPLYRLCHEIALSRISEDDYEQFLRPFAIKKWGKPLSSSVFQEIMQVTERHPYYVNALLRLLFSSVSPLSENDVLTRWHDLTERKKQDLFYETEHLSLVQKKILIAIANGKDHALTSKSFLNEYHIASATVIKSVKQLTEKNFIEKIANRYCLIDPLLKTAIQSTWNFK